MIGRRFRAVRAVRVNSPAEVLAGMRTTLGGGSGGGLWGKVPRGGSRRGGPGGGGGRRGWGRGGGGRVGVAWVGCWVGAGGWPRRWGRPRARARPRWRWAWPQ